MIIDKPNKVMMDVLEVPLGITFETMDKLFIRCVELPTATDSDGNPINGIVGVNLEDGVFCTADRNIDVSCRQVAVLNNAKVTLE